MQWTKEEYSFLKSVGDNIVRIKKEKKITSKQVYEELDMDKSNYRRIEAGKTNVSLLLARRIAKILDVSIEELTK
ncbi:MAG: helix-turn-helix domain-containing protein [Flavobacteriales bacterium]